MSTLVDGCAICNGIGQVAAGAACPVCGGTGVATADQAAQYRQLLVDAAVDAATERFRQAGSNAAEGVLRGLAQARDDAKETTARAGEVLSALLEVRRTALEVQAAALEIRSHPSAPLFVEPSAPDPTDPPPGITLPAGMGGEIFYMDSLLVRQLDVWGNLNIGGSGGLMSNPMTTLGDIITGSTGGAPIRLGIGSAAQVLTVVGGVPTWANSAAGFANPMTTTGDLIFSNPGSTPARLPIGSTGQALVVSGGLPAWSSSVLVNPMTTLGDLITGAVGGAPQRVSIGPPGYVLTSTSGLPAWQPSTSGFANPMTTSGDLITATAGGSAVRLPVGTNGQQLSVVGGVPAWAAPAASLQVANVLNFGADPTGVADSAPAFMAAYNSLSLAGSPGIGGIVYAPAGNYRINSTLAFFGTSKLAAVYLIGAGLGATTLFYYGTGDCVRMFDDYVPGGGPLSIIVWGGGVSELTIDGTNATGTGVQCGLHIGDMKRKRFSHVQIQNFNSLSPVGVGVWIDNTKFWTEDNYGQFAILNCQQYAVFDVNSSFSGTASGTGTVDIDNNQWEFNAGGVGGQSGILVTGGAFIYHSRIWFHGGLRTSSSTHTNWSALQIGSNFSASDGSAIFHSELVLQLESDGGAANTPQTIIQAHSGNNINGCWGYMNFMNGYAAGSTPGQFILMGPVHGDSTPFPLTAPSMSGVPAAGAGAGPQQTNNGPRTLVSVTGGTSVNVSIDGVSTGVASGVFEIEAGHSFGLGNYTGSPTVTYFTAVPGT